MSLYSSSQIKTHILRPSYHNSKRTEWRLPNVVLLSNIRMLGVGCTQTGGTDVKYNLSAGVKSLFQNIYLYHDNQLVCGLREAHHWLGFTNSLHGNEEQVGRQTFTARSGTGYQLDDNDEVSIVGGVGNTVTGSEATTSKGQMFLDEALSFLRDVRQVPCDKMNVRLVIEWNTALNNFFATANPTSISILEPQLIVDEVVGAKSPNQVTLPYYSLENGRAVISAVAVGVTFTDKFKIDGFNRKNVRRMLFINNMTSAPGSELGVDQSVPQLEEKISILMNGKKMLPFSGITPENKQQMVNDIFGRMCFAIADNFVGLEGAADIYDTNAQTLGFSYGALDVKQRVEGGMQFEYTRTGGSVALFQDAFDFLVFAEVQKVLSIKQGKVILA